MTPMSTLKDKVVIITGASSGIGRATAVRLAKEGAALALCGKSSAKLAETLKAVREVAPDAKVYHRAFDITDDAEVRGFVHAASKDLGAPHALVHSAGGNPCRAAVAAAEPAMWDAQFALNCRATASVVRACWPFWSLNGGGRCVVVVSTVALFANEGNGPYSASKAAQKSLCDTLRKEGRSANIGVTAVYPGGVDTDFRPQARPEYMRPESVAEAIVTSLLLPSDAVMHEIVLRPACEGNFM
jgi:NAD(P)-dependent dehydrogenase (short-subunit alcohol dehydrogenase family)